MLVLDRIFTTGSSIAFVHTECCSQRKMRDLWRGFIESRVFRNKHCLFLLLIILFVLFKLCICCVCNSRHMIIYRNYIFALKYLKKPHSCCYCHYCSDSSSEGKCNPAALWPTSKSNGAPAGDPAVGAAVEGAACGGKADRQDEAGKSDPGREPQEGDVVVKSRGAVVGMIDDLRYCSWHLIGVWSLLTLATQINTQRARAGSEGTETIQWHEKQSCRHKPVICILILPTLVVMTSIHQVLNIEIVSSN